MRLPFQFLSDSVWARRHTEPGIVDLTFGNPHEMPLPGLVDALRDWATPLTKDWFAYKMSERYAREAVAESLQAATAIPFDPADIAMTNGGFAALAVALKALTEPGDEVIFALPPWFFYRVLIAEAGLRAVPVPVQATDFDLDIAALEAAITPRTRVVLVNTPHNPTGRIYPAPTLRRLADVLQSASQAYGRPIYLLSDEAYRRLVFDGKQMVTPAAFYPHALIAYSYGKTLLAPGQRIGYLAVSPQIAEREQLRERIFATQIATGWMFPNALLQHALPDLEQLSISVPHLQRKRDRLLTELRAIGYQVHQPEGAFYLLPKSPCADDAAFADLLAAQDILVLPGNVFEMPGYFRISLTANDATIERSLAGFATAWETAQTVCRSGR
ncbi:MAG: aminotransferase [Chloroflexi bacterium]|nr:MAG: aminotransferase [Chloroflexota bacterium]